MKGRKSPDHVAIHDFLHTSDKGTVPEQIHQHWDVIYLDMQQDIDIGLFDQSLLSLRSM